MAKIGLAGGRLLAVIGIVIIALAVFIDTGKVAALSSAKGTQESYNRELTDRYQVPEPARPIDFSKLLPEPVAPPDTASAADKAAYEKDMAAYQTNKKAKEEEFAKALGAYDYAVKRYAFDKKTLEYQAAVEKQQVEKRKLDLDQSVKSREIDINLIDFTVFLRFLGAVLLLVGAAGILFFADNMERLGVLALIGFAFKTIIGL
jgi:hypothetical protein